MSERIELPEGWVSEKMVNIALINPKLPFEKIDDELMVSFLPMKNVEEESNRIRLTDKKKFREVKKGFTPMTDGDVIFAKITPCMENGKIAVVHSLLNQIAFGSTEFHVFRPDNRILLNHFLFYYLVQKQTRQLAAQQMTGAVGQRRVPKNYLEILEIPLPPLPEQHRIVAKIEALFTSLDRGIASLKTAQQQLKIYRQAVLKWAFEGKLTNESLKDGELPEGWKWVKVGEVFDVFVGSTPSRKIDEYWGGDINWISSGEVAFCKIFSTREKITQSGLEHSSCKIHPAGTIVMAMIGEGKTRGQVAMLKTEATHNQNTAAIRMGESDYSPDLLYYFFLFTYEKNRGVGSGNNQKALNKERIKQFEIPWIPPNEQHNIVAAIESRLSVCDKLEETILQSLQQAEALRQSILKKAFAGQLVPQDPNDKPASVLLERIRAERLKATTGKIVKNKKSEK